MAEHAARTSMEFDDIMAARSGRRRGRALCTGEDRGCRKRCRYETSAWQKPVANPARVRGPQGSAHITTTLVPTFTRP
jgi:hypothetical protein